MSVINTNYLALVSQNNLTKSQNALGTAIERLSSGMRINSAKDDAAGQAIANRFTANIKGLTQATRNANDGISIAQTTEGALNEINNNLQRIRELSVQAANGSNSQTDLDSIQAEIQQRLDEIDRVSEQTQFNGVRVLAQENSLTVQVGANDNETISVNLRQITSSTLGLNGFNVNGQSSIANKAANVNDLTRAGATEVSPAGSGVYELEVEHDAVTSTQAFDRLADGNTVTVGATTYTYNAASGDFSSDAATAAAGDVTALATKHTPGAGQTATGVYTTALGGETEFTVASDGSITIDGEDAFITATGELTTNKNAAGTEAATAAKLFEAVGATTGDGNTIEIDDVTYTGTANANEITYKATSSKETVQAALDAAGAGATVVLGEGVFSHTITFGADDKSNDTYIDNTGELTTVADYKIQYTVDSVDGSVTVSGGDGEGAYAPQIGATAYVNSAGDLTTETTSVGAGTANPLAALDDALANVDSLRSELGAIQNRFQSTIANLTNTVNNLSAARSRIEDADYAVEVSNMTRAQILQQAGTSVLAQANQVPQTVLSLLR